MTGDFKPVFCRRVKKYLHFIFFVRQKFVYLHSERVRGVAQPGLEYASGGRVVASSNLVTPTDEKAW